MYFFGNQNPSITDAQLAVIGNCPNTQAPCKDPNTGEDLWKKVSFLTEEQKITIGRCPDINMPCTHPPGDPNGVDLWQVVKGNVPQEVSYATISPEEEEAILAQTLPIPEPEPSFLRRNAIPLFVGGGILTLGLVGMFLMIKI